MKIQSDAAKQKIMKAITLRDENNGLKNQLLIVKTEVLTWMERAEKAGWRWGE